MLEPTYRILAGFHQLRSYVQGRLAELLRPQRTTVLVRYAWYDVRHRHGRVDQHHRNPPAHPTHTLTGESRPLQRLVHHQFPALSTAFTARTIIPHFSFSFTRAVTPSTTSRQLSTTVHALARDGFHRHGGIVTRFLSPYVDSSAMAARGSCRGSRPDDTRGHHYGRLFSVNRPAQGIPDLIRPVTSSAVPVVEQERGMGGLTRILSDQKRSIPVYLSMILDSCTLWPTQKDMTTLSASLIQTIASTAELYATHMNEVLDLLHRLQQSELNVSVQWSDSELRVYFSSDVPTRAEARARLRAIGIDPDNPHFVIEQDIPPTRSTGLDYFSDVRRFLDHVDDLIEHGPAFRRISIC